MHCLHLLRETAADIWWRMTAWMDTPADMAKRGIASRHMARVFRTWIALLEVLVRRIVYLAALELTLAPASGGAWGERQLSLTAEPRPCLRFLRSSREPAPRTATGPRRRCEPDPRGVKPAPLGHLARRLEALRHAIWYTRPHALRLARVLERRAAANRHLPQILPFTVKAHHWGAEHEMRDPILATEPLINRQLERRGALIANIYEEPG